MGFADRYFSKQVHFNPWFSFPPTPGLKFVVVIPACRETEVTTTLESLRRCVWPGSPVEVMIIFNLPADAPETTVESTHLSVDTVCKWIKSHTHPHFAFLVSDILNMSPKDAGVGMARKAGMDQALFRLNKVNRPDGFILSFDADSTCDPNYFIALENTLEQHPRTVGTQFYFEHPLDGERYPEVVYRGITAYELHLRCMNQYIRFTGFPFAYHTLGSSFGVRADIYAAQGGMNKRKAGEDFYFLHKIIPLGEFREINETRIIPSPRASDRVPFGTGAAISRYVQTGDGRFQTYSPGCFHDLRSFFTLVPSLYQASTEETVKAMLTLPPSIYQFLHEIQAIESLEEIRRNAASLPAFTNRFYRWFDAFRIIKFLNFASRSFHPQVPVDEAVYCLLKDTGHPLPAEGEDDKSLLLWLRSWERNHPAIYSRRQ